jgi:uncharacterized phage-like protein YoqJ
MRKVLSQHKAEMIISGMALGVDHLWAETGIALGIPVVAAIPFPGQDAIWPEESKQRYRGILAHPLVLEVYISKGAYNPDLMKKRNCWMVDHCDLLVAVWDGSRGGTAHCARYAKAVSKPVFYIDPRRMNV